MASGRTIRQMFFIVSALLFTVSVAVTIVCCVSMSAMGGMRMPGGWTMSMTWMRMSGQSWPGAAVSFLGMWIVMMVAMMLPCLLPVLRRYQQAVCCTGSANPGRLTASAGAGYFFVWTLFGVLAYVLGIVLATIEMQQPVISRAVPVAAGITILLAGSLQFTAWKVRHLSCCRQGPACDCTLPADAAGAWRQGLRFGLHCSQCCAGLMAILLVIGVMNLYAMVIVTAAITLERLTPAPARVARVIGIAGIGTGLWWIWQAAVPGF